MPINARGFLLNAPMNLCLSFLGTDAYSASPVSPVRLMNALPVCLWWEIKSVAVSRCFTLEILLRQDTVRGRDQSFF
jgi:hypothetical protein